MRRKTAGWQGIAAVLLQYVWIWRITQDLLDVYSLAGIVQIAWGMF